jgi:hypothetical protein
MRSVAIKRALVLTATGLALFACGAPEARRSEGASSAAGGEREERSSEPAPDFTVETFGGQQFTPFGATLNSRGAELLGILVTYVPGGATAPQPVG